MTEALPAKYNAGSAILYSYCERTLCMVVKSAPLDFYSRTIYR